MCIDPKILERPFAIEVAIKDVCMDDTMQLSILNDRARPFFKFKAAAVIPKLS